MYYFIQLFFRLYCSGLNWFVKKISFFTTGSFLFLFIYFSGMGLSAQRVIDVDKFDGSPLKGQFYNVAGSAVSMAKYIRVVEGSPFFLESWMKGSAILPNGNQIDNLLLKLDLLAGEIYFLGSSGSEFVATAPVAELLLKDTLSGNEYHFVHSTAFLQARAPERGWYLVLCEGPSALFKRFQKSMRENKPYNSATYEQTITTSSVFYVLINNRFFPVKKFSSLPEVFIDKKTELQQFVKKSGLSGKSDSDYILLVQHYNSLVHEK